MTEAPSFGSLKLASPDDVLRLGVVCTAGFRYSEQFIWERTAHAQYPQSTMNWFRQEVMEFIRKPEFIALVALDDYDPDESSKTEAIIPVDNGWTPPKAGTPVVVGLGVWRLQPGSPRIGKYQNETGPYPDVPEYDYKDLDRKRSQAFAHVCIEAGKKYFEGLSEMERIVVHPAYWRRGHGSTIAKWGVQLADIDSVDQGVLATSMGADLFRHVGYELITDLHVEGDEKNPEGVTFAALKHTATLKAKGKWTVFSCTVI
ncbi:hypothetical protein QBC38DRAFT_459353 [Podospora fimiseda]|uniref:N-acetyltransferase domain-containing protein n=1 Tax=Podospora fimiseda TaxID=252190 RepID=A0AAN7GNU0_9PEZI|nr:hypothetical protein QBC38DRAFT_459353 [Podospora fimiseda]